MRQTHTSPNKLYLSSLWLLRDRVRALCSSQRARDIFYFEIGISQPYSKDVHSEERCAEGPVIESCTSEGITVQIFADTRKNESGVVRTKKRQ